ncbi:MAG: hypothetical protein RSD29_01800 [Bacilli bacterium]
MIRKPTSGKEKLSIMKYDPKFAINVPVSNYDEISGISINAKSYH